jgi:hypothetical protein
MSEETRITANPLSKESRIRLNILPKEEELNPRLLQRICETCRSPWFIFVLSVSVAIINLL